MEKEYEVEEMKPVLAEYIDKLMETICIEMVEQAKINIVANGHDKTGKLKNSIEWKKIGPMHYEVIAGAEYSGFLEYGTKPHKIEAKDAKALHWVDGRKDRFAKSVNHPGNKPSPFMEPAFLEAKRKAEENKY